MNDLLKPKRRKNGSVTLVIIGVLVVLLIMFSSFLRVTTQRKGSSKKVGSLMLSRELSAALAEMASQYLKNAVLLKNDDDKGRCALKSYLSLPIGEMSDKKVFDLSYIKNEFNQIRDSANNGLWQQLIKHCGLNIKNPDSDIKLSCIVEKKDFKPINGVYKAYQRAKRGRIRLLAEITCIFEGTKKPIEESYEYTANIVVAPNIVPVLSRFTLFVSDALNGRTVNRFNRLDLDITGTIKNGEENRPWVLKNDKNNDCGKKLYRDLLEKTPAGLVYLGSPDNRPIELGLSRGWVNSGKSKFGEDFLFYKNENEAAGYWKTVKRLENDANGNARGIMSANIGLCADEGGENADWLNQMGSGLKETAKHASVLKLYGTDEKPSPTLVLGCVASKFMSVNMYKSGSNIDFLKHFDSEAAFLSELALENIEKEGAESGSLANFGFDIYTAKNIPPSFEYYLENYAGTVAITPYNMGYLYAFRPNTPFPIGNGVNESDLMAKYSVWQPKTPDASFLNAVPKPYSGIYGEGVMLNEAADKFCKFVKENALGSKIGPPFRPGRIIDLSKLNGQKTQKLFADNTLFKELFLLQKKHGQSRLNLNGCLVIKAKSLIALSGLDIISHGVIIVDGANIELKGNIISRQNAAHLTLIALNGSITVGAQVTRLDASLYALGQNGQVKFEKNTNTAVEVNGNIAMQKFFGPNQAEDDNLFKREVRLNYNTALAAMPVVSGFAPTEEGLSDKALLMFDYADDMRLIE